MCIVMHPVRIKSFLYSIKMSFVNKLSVFAIYFATAVKPAYRGATAVMHACLQKWYYY